MGDLNFLFLCVQKRKFEREKTSTIIAKLPILKYYVYLLISPLDNKIFYVGKGKDFRFIANISNIAAEHNQWDKGIKTVEEIESSYSCLSLKKKPHKLLCINISRSFKGLSDIYEITGRSWVLNLVKVNEVDYVVAECKGVISAIFKVDEKGWRKVDSEENVESTGLVISHWMSTRYIIEFMGLWKKRHNPNFNVTEFSNIKRIRL